jgi:hypothetical protein
MNQTLFDIALQHCGDQEAATAIALLNGIDVTDTPETGTELLLPDIVNRRVFKYYNDNKIKPATKLPE